MSSSLIKLIDCCEFLDHLRKPVKKINRKEGAYPYYGANGQQGTIDDYLFNEDLVLLAEDGGHFRDPTRGIAYKISGKSWVNNHAHVLRPKNIIDINYLHYSLNQKDIRKHLTGSTRDKLTKSGASNIEIPLPPLDEQRRIAKILDKIKHIEDLYNKRNLHLNSFIDSLFNFYFGDLLTNSKSFKQRNFEDIVYFQEGPGIRKWQFRDAGIKLVNVRNIVNGELDINNTSRYLEESEVNKKYKHFLLDEGDLVMSSSGVTWGKIAYVERNNLPLCLNTSMIRLKPKSKEIRHSFIYYFIQSKAFKSQINKLITGSAQPNFGPSHLRQIRCPLPSLSNQLEFEIILNKYTKMYSNCKQIRNREEEFSLSTVNSLLLQSNINNK